MERIQEPRALPSLFISLIAMSAHRDLSCSVARTVPMPAGFTCNWDLVPERNWQQKLRDWNPLLLRSRRRGRGVEWCEERESDLLFFSKPFKGASRRKRAKASWMPSDALALGCLTAAGVRRLGEAILELLKALRGLSFEVRCLRPFCRCRFSSGWCCRCSGRSNLRVILSVVHLLDR